MFCLYEAILNLQTRHDWSNEYNVKSYRGHENFRHVNGRKLSIEIRISEHVVTRYYKFTVCFVVVKLFQTGLGSAAVFEKADLCDNQFS